MVESTIREFLYFSSLEEDHGDVLDILRTVGLESTIRNLSEGLDTRIAATGWPLSITETMQLKLASAIIARPRVLVLTKIFDVMPDNRLLDSLNLLQQRGDHRFGDRERTAARNAVSGHGLGGHQFGGH